MSAAVKVLPVQHNMHDFEIGTCVLKRKLNNPLIKAFWNTAGRSLGEDKRLY
jgi:hypothetical protein